MIDFARYLVVGSVAFAVHLATLESLLTANFPSASAASAIGFLVACVVNFTLQRAWVFRSMRGVSDAVARYGAVTLATLGVNTFLFSLLHAGCGIPPAAAQTATTGSVFVINFFCNRHFTFAPAPGQVSR
jgi:putative flippase GtrA